jgi:hypothetical protein
MTTVLLFCIVAVGSAYVGHRWWPYSWGSLWRWILCRTIKPLLWRTGLRLVHQDYIDHEVYMGELEAWQRYRSETVSCPSCKFDFLPDVK